MTYNEPKIMRIKRPELQALNPNGRPCETCNGPMKDHEWTDMDRDGFVVRCSNGEANEEKEA
jgi:hypothetical protein